MKNRGATTSPRPPAGLSTEARRLWRDVTAGWAIDAPALRTLAVACAALTTHGKAQAILRREGPMIVDRFQQQKMHPMAAVARDSAASYLNAMRALNLDLEPIRD